MLIDIPLVGHSYEDISLPLNAQRTWNLYVRPGGPQGRVPAALCSFPGFREVVRFGAGSEAIRGLHVASIGGEEVLFVVVGNKAYRTNYAFSPVTEIGTLDTAIGPVGMAWNGFQLLIAEDLPRSQTSAAYVYDEATGIFVNLHKLYSIAFTAGSGSGFQVGETITGGTSLTTARVVRVTVDSGSWAGGDAAGTVLIDNLSGNFAQAGETITGGTSGTTASTVDAELFEGLDFGVTGVTILNGRFVVNENNSGRFWWSDILDGFSWGGLSYATAETAPDNLLAVFASGEALWLFGEYTTEVWVPTADPDLPFQRVGGGAIQAGCSAPASIADHNGTVVWVANARNSTPFVARATSYSSYEEISTPALSARLGRLQKIAGAIGLSWRAHGMSFYSLYVEDADATFVLSEGGWVDFAAWDETTGTMVSSPITAAAYVQTHGKQYMAGPNPGTLFTVDSESAARRDAPVMCMRTTPPVHQGGRTIFWNRLEVDLEAGLALSGDDTLEIFLSWSDDGGKSWSPPLRRSLGGRGDWRRRVAWHQLGASPYRVYRVAVYGKAPVRLYAARADIDVET